MAAVKLNEAMKKAVYVSNDIDLKSAIARNELVVISDDINLYKNLLSKFSKDKIAKKTNGFGKILMGIGATITVATYGLFAFVGVPIAAVGAALGVGGKALDDYEKYTIAMNHDEKQVAFFKTKGEPHISKKELK